jgi:predicted metal-dependent enzyme (double-stranded beta helix superfamily)
MLSCLPSKPEISAMTESYPLEQYVDDLRSIVADSSDEDEIIGRVGPLAQRVVADKSWLQPKHYETDEEQGFGVHLLHEEADHSLAVILVSWLPGRGTPPHDHGTWAVVVGIEGVERNVRYKRLDDRSKSDYAELAVKEDFAANEGELVCIRTGGIHKVTNETERMTLSLHTYGRHINHTNRSQFNLDTNERTEFIVRVE